MIVWLWNDFESHEITGHKNPIRVVLHAHGTFSNTRATALREVAASVQHMPAVPRLETGKLGMIQTEVTRRSPVVAKMANK